MSEQQHCKQNIVTWYLHTEVYADKKTKHSLYVINTN